ncbi:hypothetical protein LOK49_LG06G01379 [Camellia lanceoleosa]|uniref:Uncharacterized protein n=1 Tax=Camellia lanceoleosa TaxID=1840588 RepID=A0ACC0HCC1_9ERIC|nr:hypothetical protein LOK49_LG06G01379 [Camellia lanceoleosa]
MVICNKFLLYWISSDQFPLLRKNPDWISLSFLSLHRHQFPSCERRSIENDAIDCLLLVHSDLSSLIRQGLDFVIDAGVRAADPSTVVDMTGGLPRIILQGKGPKQLWMVAEDDKDSAVEEEEPTLVLLKIQ